MSNDKSRRLPPNLLALARQKRRPMSSAEARLWFRLRSRQLGCKFRRQHIIGNYIVDFVCLETRLIIELDGILHEATEENDLERTRILEAVGYKLIRFTNREVMDTLDSVVEAIHAECEKRAGNQRQDPQP